STSIPPNAERQWSTKPCTAVSSLTSAATEETVPPSARIRAAVSSTASSTRSTATTFAPSRAKRRALARPMPLPAPVTIALFPARRPIFVSPCLYVAHATLGSVRRLEQSKRNAPDQKSLPAVTAQPTLPFALSSVPELPTFGASSIGAVQFSGWSPIVVQIVLSATRQLPPTSLPSAPSTTTLEASG